MFGIFAMIFLGGAKVADVTNNNIFNVESRKNAFEKGEQFYFDHKGTRRAVDNKEQIVISSKFSDDTVYVGSETGKIYRKQSDLDLAKKNKAAEGKVYHWEYRTLKGKREMVKIHTETGRRFKTVSVTGKGKKLKTKVFWYDNDNDTVPTEITEVENWEAWI